MKKFFIIVLLVFTLVNLMIHQVSVEENKRVKIAAEEYVAYSLEMCTCAENHPEYTINFSGGLFGE